MEPFVLTVGRFNLEIINAGDIVRWKISTPATIPGAENLMYEPSEYNYDNDDEISK